MNPNERPSGSPALAPPGQRPAGMRLTRNTRIGVTVAAGALGVVAGALLTQHGTRRERVLTAALAGTAGVGLATTILNLASLEN